MPDIDIVYILVSKELEKNKYEYLQRETTKHLAKYIDQNKVIYYEPVFKNRDEDQFDKYEFHSSLRRGEKGIWVSYLNMYKEIIDAGYETALILESDTIFFPDFSLKLDEVFNEWLQVSSEPSILFIGNGCSFKPKTPLISENLHLENRNKCTDSIIYKRSSITRFYNYVMNLNIIDLPIDLTLDRVFGYHKNENNINGYWIHTPIVKQGSQCGIYKSTIQDEPPIKHKPTIR
jgi:glycosyl transferase family 25